SPLTMRQTPPKMSLMDIHKMLSMLQPRHDNDADTTEEDAEDSEELTRAVSRDDHATLDRLLSQARYKRLIERRSGWGVPGTPLRLAAARGHLRSLRVLLAHGAEVDGLDVKAQTPLFVAVSHGHRECAAALLGAGASPAGSLYNNCSPLLVAARDGHTAILRLLLERGAEPNVQPRLPPWAAGAGALCSGPLYLAAAYGHLDCFRTLLLYGAEPNYNCATPGVVAQVKEPKTLLETCLRHGGRGDFVRLLIDFGANVYLPSVAADGPAPRSEGLELLLHARAHPKSLLSQSRLAMRRLLKQPDLLSALRKLEIPTVLANYLQHQP
ncbi:ASB12 protein, partial [Formicarius rufipectus]|nr:ASB12 protein [Formicarius rufipectus]